MSIGRALTDTELSILHLIAEEVRQCGKEHAPSYLAIIDPAWREIVDAIFGVDDTRDDENGGPNG